MSLAVTPPWPLTGSCFCSAVTYALSAPPVLRASRYCHCTQCQRLTGCPFIHTVHFPASAFSWTHDAPVDTFVNPLRLWKIRTRRCHPCAEISVWGPHFARDGSGRILYWEEVRPTAHMFYGTRLIDTEDGLGKWEGCEGKSGSIT
ncbi:Mss4-like protein [Lactifluus subvellereus]|nr:Mss4-like protein [Lactifluus subvellereus]